MCLMKSQGVGGGGELRQKKFRWQYRFDVVMVFYISTIIFLSFWYLHYDCIFVFIHCYMRKVTHDKRSDRTEIKTIEFRTSYYIEISPSKEIGLLNIRCRVTVAAKSVWIVLGFFLPLSFSVWFFAWAGMSHAILPSFSISGIVWLWNWKNGFQVDSHYPTSTLSHSSPDKKSSCNLNFQLTFLLLFSLSLFSFQQVFSLLSFKQVYSNHW